MLLSTNLGNCGGAEVQVMELAVNLAKLGWKVEAVSLLPPEGAIPAAVRESGVEIRSLEMTPGIPDPRALLRLLAMLRRFRPDVLHCHMTHANLLGRIAHAFQSVPVVISTLHGMQMNSIRGGPTRVRELLHRATDRWTRLTTTVCHAAATAYISNRAVPASKVKAVHNGVDTAAYSPDSAIRRHMRAELGLEGKFVWLAVGRLVKAKAYDVMLQAFARQCEAGDQDGVLLVCGTGPLEQDLRQMIRLTGLETRVHLLGFRQDIPNLMRVADCFLMSSDTEGFPMALIQAASSGLPIVATSVGGNAEAVTDGETGCLVPPRDLTAFTAAMMRVRSMSMTERDGMGLRARQHTITHYDSLQIANYWERIYLDLLHGGTGQVGPPSAAKASAMKAGMAG